MEESLQAGNAITNSGSISADWVLVGVVLITCFLLVRLLTSMDKKLESHDNILTDHEARIKVQENITETYKSNHEDLAVSIALKLKAMGAMRNL